ncbi:MAG: DUF5658 family protein [Gudongella sp.]|nr:DUF5658 family protein [Gudongella sp.]
MKKNIHFTEANPIMASMVGTYQFPMVKLVLVPLLLIFLWQHKERIGNMLVSLTWIPFLGYLSLMVYYRFLIVTFT